MSDSSSCIISLGEWVDIRTSAQLGYTVPFTLVYAGKYRTEHKLQTKHNLEKAANAKHSKTKQPYVASYGIRLGDEVGLFYNVPEPTGHSQSGERSKFPL